MDGSLVIALFRHGLTEENKRKAFTGWTDIPLSEEAIPFLEKQRAKLPSYQRIIASDLKRCIQTANLLFPKQEIESMTEFREIHFGAWEGKVHRELTGDPYYEQWLVNWFETVMPGGESTKIFQARVESGWRKVCQLIEENKYSSLAIVTHAGVMQYLLSKYGNEQESFLLWKIPNGSGFELIWNDRGAFRRGERCTLLREVPLTENRHG